MKWNSEADEAFVKSKSMLSEKTLVEFLDPKAELSIVSDASDVSISGVLQQKQPESDTWKPVSFFSRKLNATQKKYSIFSRELMAIFQSIKYFRHLVEGREFHVITDHKPLLTALQKKSARDIPRESRWLEYIAMHTTDVRFLKGVDNVVADSLSRHLENANHEDEEMNQIWLNNVVILNNDTNEDLKTAQKYDIELERLLAGDLKMDPILVLENDLYVVKGNNRIRPYIPGPLRKKIFNSFHNLAHPGVAASIRNLAARYFWPGMRRDIKNWVQTCIQCQKAKVTRHNKTPVGQMPPSSGKFRDVHIDIVGPLSTNQGYSYLLTIIDRYSRWLEVVPLRDIKSETIVDAFLLHWVARYGVPETLISDRGAQFESSLWKIMTRKLGIYKIHTPAYTPSMNGLIERQHRIIKDALRAHAITDNHSWLQKLPFILLNIRSSLREDVKKSSAQIVFGTDLALPGDLLMPYGQREEVNIFDYAEKLKSFMQHNTGINSRTYPDKHYLDPKLRSCSHVFIRNDRKRGLEPNYLGPYKVIRRLHKVFVVELPRGNDTVSIDRLKVAYLPSEVLECKVSDQREIQPIQPVPMQIVNPTPRTPPRRIPSPPTPNTPQIPPRPQRPSTFSRLNNNSGRHFLDPRRLFQTSPSSSNRSTNNSPINNNSPVNQQESPRRSRFGRLLKPPDRFVPG